MAKLTASLCISARFVFSNKWVKMDDVDYFNLRPGGYGMADGIWDF